MLVRLFHNLRAQNDILYAFLRGCTIKKMSLLFNATAMSETVGFEAPGYRTKLIVGIDNCIHRKPWFFFDWQYLCGHFERLHYYV